VFNQNRTKCFESSLKRGSQICLLVAALAPLGAIGATYTVSTSAQLTDRLALAVSGDVIVLKAGVYQPSKAVANVKTIDNVLTVAPMFYIHHAANVTIKGESRSNKPVLKASGIDKGEYVLYAKYANNLILQDLKIENSEKGIVIDRSNDVTVNYVDIKNIGWEALHIRDGSQKAKITNNTLQSIGLIRNDRGEGVYVGSDKKKWHPDEHTKGESFYQPNCDGAVIENNSFGPNIGAEAVDVKEGVTGTVIRNNTFNMGLTDTRLKNSSSEKADSAVDVKGYKTVVMNNKFSVGGNPNIITAIDVYALIDKPSIGYDKWGYNNFFTSNSLSGDSVTQAVVRVGSYGGATVGCNTNAQGDPHIIGSKKKAKVTVIEGSACNTPKF
jgi:hypothetical protein